jgi:hypothetical protein
MDSPSESFYYAARLDDQRCKNIPTARFPHTVAKKWDIVFLVLHTYLHEGMYDHDDGNRYYLGRISWEEFDMLKAFGVTCVTDFHADYPCSDPNVTS